MSRDEYTAPARQRRSAATEMRLAGLSLRAIATALRCSLAEIQRVLTAGVQGSPGLSDFKGAPAPSSAITDAPTLPIGSSVPRDVLTLRTYSTVIGGLTFGLRPPGRAQSSAP